MDSAIRGDRVRRLRIRRGLTQKELAALAQISQSYLSEIESGKQQSVGSVAILGLAQTLGTNMDYLAGNSDDPARVEAEELQENVLEIIRGLADLSDADRQVILDLIDCLVRREQEKVQSGAPRE